MLGLGLLKAQDERVLRCRDVNSFSLPRCELSFNFITTSNIPLPRDVNMCTSYILGWLSIVSDLDFYLHNCWPSQVDFCIVYLKSVGYPPD